MNTTAIVGGTVDQNDVIDRLNKIAVEYGIELHADPMPHDEPAIDRCGGGCDEWGTVHLPNEAYPVCPECARAWMYWHRGGVVALDITRIPLNMED